MVIKLLRWGFFLTHSIIKKIKVIETKIIKQNGGLK